MEPVSTRERKGAAALGCLEAYAALVSNVHEWQPIETYKPAWADQHSVPCSQGAEPARETRTRIVSGSVSRGKGIQKDGSLRRRLHAPRLGRELDVAARLPVVLGLRALPEHAHSQIAGVHLPIARSDDDADVADLRGASWSLDSVRTASTSKKKPPTTSSPGDDS